MNFIKWVYKNFLPFFKFIFTHILIIFFKKIFQNFGSITMVIATIVTAIATGVLAYYNYQYIKILNNERMDRFIPSITISNELIIKYKDSNESMVILNNLGETERYIPLDKSDLFEVEYNVKNIGAVPVVFSILNYDPELFINDQLLNLPLTEYAYPELHNELHISSGEVKSFIVPYEMGQDIKNVFRDSKNKVNFRLQPRIQYSAMGEQKLFSLNLQFDCIFSIKDGTKLYPICNVRKP